MPEAHLAANPAESAPAAWPDIFVLHRDLSCPLPQHLQQSKSILKVAAALTSQKLRLLGVFS